MSFAREFPNLPLASWLEIGQDAAPLDVERALARPVRSLRDFAALISPAGLGFLEELSRQSQELTRQRFGRVIRLFAPLYLSNECINSCRYCGFSRENPILRVTLSPEEVAAEARALKETGFRNLLLVAGEHPKFVSPRYLEACLNVLREEIPALSLEVGPMETGEYVSLAAAGAEGLVVYQETYDREVYQQLHTAGPKKDFDWRLATAERAYAGGFRRLGIGALFGLSNWRREALCLAAHCDFLLRHCWKAQLTISLPRLRPSAGGFVPPSPLPDRELVQLICALRLTFPDAGLVLSTREPARLRDGLIPLGVTMVSAGSHTEPGGYTGAGRDRIHQTARGKILELAPGASEWAGPAAANCQKATEQFEIADARSPREIAAVIRRLGYDPVWKDWDPGFLQPPLAGDRTDALAKRGEELFLQPQ